MMSSKWKLKDPNTLRVFFSSPFGGMEGEREELTKKYFPQFHHACNAVGVQFVAVDLRWGITSESVNNAQVINICLKELDRSDVFVGFYGQRYGWHGSSDELLQRNFDNAIGYYPWLKDFRERSVTELEFLHGHLNNPGARPICICFRDKAYDEAIHKDLVAKEDKFSYKYTAENENSTHRLSDLISRVKESQDKSLGVDACYKDPIAGAKFMFESVFPTCLKLLESRDLHELSPLEQARIPHNAKLAMLTSLFIGGEDYIKNLSYENLKANPKCLVSGAQGCGKSAVLANVVHSLKDHNPELNVIYHFVGSGPGTTDPFRIFERILNELEQINKEKSTKEDDPLESKSAVDDEYKFHNMYIKFQQEMEKLVANGERLVLVIDALNKVKAGVKTAKHLYWLPEKYPDGVSVIVSAVATDTATYDLLVSERKFMAIEIDPLSEEAQKVICEESLKINAKELSVPQMQRVVDALQTSNPLFLKIFLGEVSIWGDFFTLDQRIDSLIYCHGIQDLLTSVLKRLEEDYNMEEHSGPLVQQVLSAIAVSHSGLSENEIKKMFNIASHVWSPFYFALENFLISHGGLLRFSFSEVSEAVKERYLKTEDARKQAMNIVVDFFNDILQNSTTTDYLNNTEINRVANELPWLQKSLDDKEGLFQTISDVCIFHSLVERSNTETIDLWKASGVSADEFCTNLLKSFDNAVCHLYLTQQECHEENVEPPGYTVFPLLTSVKNFFTQICHHKSHIAVLQKGKSILEGINGRLNRDDVRITMLRDQNYHLGATYVDDSQYKAGQELLELVKKECESYLETCDDPRARQTLGYCCNGIGLLYMRQGYYEQAESFIQKSSDIHQLLGNDQCVMNALQNIGTIKMNIGEFDKAMEYFNKVMELFERIYFGHLSMDVGNLLTNMAVTQRKMGNMDEAEKLYLRSLEIKAHAVGWDHEVVATTYMNLGTFEMYRANWPKAEEYTRKAVAIYEGNNVKLEQNEMWQSLENLVTVLEHEGQMDDALPIFLRVFAMLKHEEKVYQGSTGLHKRMMGFMLTKGMFLELIDILEAYITSPQLRSANLFKIFDHCYQQVPVEERKQRPEELTVEYALREIWPGENELTAYMITNYVLPQNDIEKVLEMLDMMDKKNPDYLASTYSVGGEWCEGCSNWQALVQVARAGLEKYPDDMGLKVKLFDGLRRLQKNEEAYPLIEDILKNESDNQALILISGQVALMCNDLELCKELWEKVSVMPDESLAEKAKSGLKQIAEVTAATEKNQS